MIHLSDNIILYHGSYTEEPLKSLNQNIFRINSVLKLNKLSDVYLL